MKKIITLIAIMCCFSWCNCKVEHNETERLMFNCMPFDFETNVLKVKYTFYRHYNSIYNITKETVYTNGYRTVMTFYKKSDDVVQRIDKYDQFNTKISVEQKVTKLNLTSLYLDFKELYNIK